MVEKTKETKKVEEPKKVEKEAEKPTKNSSTQSIVIAVLITLLVCVVLTVGILLLTGVLKFGETGGRPTEQNNISSNTEPTNKPSDGRAGTTPGGVTCYSDTRAQIYDLEFCLPKNFEEGDRGKDGAWTYNLLNDDGWAEVHAYFMKSSRTPTQFINYLSSNLKVVDQNYTVNGTTWVRAEAGDYMEAFAAQSGDYLYAVFYSIKLDSDTTKEAWKMIPETLVITE